MTGPTMYLHIRVYVSIINILNRHLYFRAGGEQDGLSSLLGGRSPDAAASDLSDGLSTPDHDHGEYNRRPFCTHRR